MLIIVIRSKIIKNFITIIRDLAKNIASLELTHSRHKMNLIILYTFGGEGNALGECACISSLLSWVIYTVECIDSVRVTLSTLILLIGWSDKWVDNKKYENLPIYNNCNK